MFIRIFSLIQATVLALMLFSSCRKEPEIERSAGTFAGVMNGGKWAPPIFEAVYYTNYNEIIVTATDDLTQQYFSCGIALDPLNLYGIVVFESNGNSSAQIVLDHRKYTTDHNIQQNAGNFKLIKLDTVSKKLSAEINVTGFNRELNKPAAFTSTKIEDIPLEVNNVANDSSFLAAEIDGANKIKWHSTFYSSSVDCVSQNKYKTLTFTFHSLGGTRHMVFKVPLWLGTGEFELKPNAVPFFYCGSGYHTTVYTFDQYEHGFLPTTGKIRITALDTIKRTLSATFNMTLLDSVSKTEVIKISNGQIRLSPY